MHPEQERIRDEDYDGSSQLSGVSGSGKTCIAVSRAIRLAQLGVDRRVLIVTLNRSLSGLISRLVDHAVPDEEVSERIQVKSLFGLFQELLAELEPDRKKYYDSETWKTKEPR